MLRDADGSPECITYLIANHNHGRYIGECLASLHRQTSPAWYALIADDASTDHSLTVLAPLIGGRIRLVRNPINLGYTATLRRLVELATTDLVAVLDADDALFPHATERLLRAYDENPGAEFVYSRFAAYDHSLRVCEGVHGAAVPPGKTSLQAGFVGAIRSFRKRAYQRTAGLDPSMRFAEDRDLVLKLEEVARPIFVADVLYKYRAVPGSQSRDPSMREEGARNARRARQAALRRREIRGFSRAFYEAVFLAEYVSYSTRFRRPVQTAAGASLRMLLALDRVLGMRTHGRGGPFTRDSHDDYS
jgi:glycosyltransferase involved in cell wall biosynthesis